MRYLLIISHDDAFAPSDDLVAGIFAWIERMQARGLRVHGNPLQPADQAITVRVRVGETVTSPGPFAATAEQISAYELLDCDSLEVALAAAAEHPMAAVATIEVRPVWDALAGRPATALTGGDHV